MFCSSGTTLECANKLGRKWIDVDNSDVAIDKIKNRQYVILSMFNNIKKQNINEK